MALITSDEVDTQGISDVVDSIEECLCKKERFESFEKHIKERRLGKFVTEHTREKQ